MLPATLVTLGAALLIHQTASSPLFNMQPAFITENIGSSGRNIRHLPCVSRRNGMTGTCMFAIDCLKANGTHLGTCIDRFYFGSCCHLNHTHDVSENVIDTALIPGRQPPSRVSTTERATTLNATTKEASATQQTTTQVPTRRSTTVPVAKPVMTTVALETTQKPTQFGQKIDPAKTTQQPETVTTKPTTQRVSTTTQRVSTTTQRVQTSKPTTTKPTTTTKTPTTTQSFKLSTFQLVNESNQTTVKPKPTTKPTKPTKPTTTTKYTTTRPKPRPSSKPVSTIKPTTKPTIVVTKYTRPTRPTSKPTTKSPVTRLTTESIRTTIKTTETPTTRTTVKPVVTTTRVITRKPPVTTIKTTTRPITTTPTTTTTPATPTISSTSIPKLETTVTTTTITSTAKPDKPLPEEIKPVLPSSTTVSNDILTTKRPADVDSIAGNTATNEIEQVPEKNPIDKTTTMPTLVTWAMVNEQSTQKPNVTNETDDTWTPMKPPDGWVLLPSVSTTLPTPTDTPAGQATNATPQSASPSAAETPVATNATASSSSEAPTTPGPSLNDTGLPTSKPLNMSDHTEVCGRRMFPEARIVGGDKSTFGKWPWQISLRQWKTSTYLHKCGAALLNENWAITAAHCVDNVPPSDLLLRLGEHDLSTDNEPYVHQERRVQIVASHPQFDPRTFEYDLALLRFYEPVQFQPNIVPVCVPQDDENFVGRTAHVTGWGRLYEDGPLPSQLQEVSVPVIRNDACEAMYRNAGYIEHIPNIFICAGWRKGGYDSCEGDSGGPMVIQRTSDRRYVLAGIISWGIGCAEPNQPGVYTRISEFRDWINQILQF